MSTPFGIIGMMGWHGRLKAALEQLRGKARAPVGSATRPRSALEEDLARREEQMRQETRLLALRYPTWRVDSAYHEAGHAVPIIAAFGAKAIKSLSIVGPGPGRQGNADDDIPAWAGDLLRVFICACGPAAEYLTPRSPGIDPSPMGDADDRRDAEEIVGRMNDMDWWQWQDRGRRYLERNREALDAIAGALNASDQGYLWSERIAALARPHYITQPGW